MHVTTWANDDDDYDDDDDALQRKCTVRRNSKGTYLDKVPC